MKIYLKHVFDYPVEKTVQISVSERLPEIMPAPCTLQCIYSIYKSGSKYVLKVRISGLVELECQRCAEIWQYFYDNTHTLKDDELMIHEDMSIDLLDIITDDLHLFLPDKHPEGDCV